MPGADGLEEVILVDEDDRAIGFEEKLAAHRNGGKLHRAFSIFIFNRRGELLLQKRSARKYHFGGLWTNACCGHPTREEPLEQAAHRRLREELGFDTGLRRAFSTAEDLERDLAARTEDFSPWLAIALPRVLALRRTDGGGDGELG